jgi:hypothetical protein
MDFLRPSSNSKHPGFNTEDTEGTEKIRKNIFPEAQLFCALFRISVSSVFSVLKAFLLQLWKAPNHTC